MIHSQRTKAGFVPVELLAILTVVFLLVGIALPAIVRVKSRSQATLCLANHRQLARAWEMYAQSNSGRAANNFTIPYTLNAIVQRKFDSWANNVMTWSAGGDTTDTSVTNEAWAASSLLHEYTDGDIEVYKCASDRFLSAAQRQRGYKKRLRSFSMNCLMGRLDSAPSSASGRSWAFGGQYRQWLKVGDIPNPAMTWLTIDEHPDSINDGLFINDVNASTWGDIPGSLHAGAANFSFADGHVETRKWRSARTRYPVIFRYPNVRSFDAEGRKDFAWYVERAGLVRF